MSSEHHAGAMRPSPETHLASRFRAAYTCPMKTVPDLAASHLASPLLPPEFEVLVEVPLGSFLKWGSSGGVDFISPLPCPFNYGSIPRFVGLEGDLLDAVVLGRRRPRGTLARVKAWGAVVMADRGMIDDKVICSDSPVTPRQRLALLRFFRFYAKCKGVLNFWRRQPGRNACEGWIEVDQAIARARPRDQGWDGPSIQF